MAFLSQRGSRFVGAAGGHAVADDFAVLGADADDVAALEASFDAGDADGQEAGRVISGGERVDGALVDDDRTFFESFTEGDPALAALLGFLGDELRAGFAAVRDGLQDAGGGAVSDVHGDAEARELVRDGALGEHPAAPELRFAGSDILAEVLRGGVDLLDHRVAFALHVEKAVHVREDDVAIDLQHRGDEAGEFVVIGEHQLGDGDGVVLVDDGHDFLREQRLEAGAHVEVVLPVAEVPLRHKQLRAGHAVLFEAVVVGVDEADLSGGGEHLARLDRREISSERHDAAPRADSAGGDENDFDAIRHERGDLRSQAVENRRVELAVAPRDDVGANLDDNSPVYRMFVRHALRLTSNVPD